MECDRDADSLLYRAAILAGMLVLDLVAVFFRSDASGFPFDVVAQQLCAGDILDGSTVHVTAGAEGLIVGDRVIASRRERPTQAVVH